MLIGGLRKGFWEQFQVPKFFKKNKFDIIHFTYPAYPLRGLGTKSVITIHDMIQFTDSRYSKKIRSKIYFWLVRKSLSKSVANPDVKFIGVSEATTAEFKRFFPSAKIETIHEGASEEFLRPVSAKTGLKQPYLLYVGGYDPRKNTQYLLEVFSHIQKDIPEMKLVLAGRLPKDIARGTLNILKTGAVNEEELNTLYKEAEAFINLSENEGFNLPVLEAAYAGTPIIISDIPVHRELYGQHGLLVQKNNAQEASRKILELLNDKTKLEKMRKETAFLRSKYTWEKSSKKTYQLYLKSL